MLECRMSTRQRSKNVIKLLKPKENEYNFMIILGDNYYPNKITLQKEKDGNPEIKIK